MTEATVKVKVPDEAVRGVVCAEVTKRLGDPEKLVSAWVERLLNEQVPPRGNKYGRKQPRIEEEIDHLIKTIVESVIAETVAEQRSKLETAIRKALTVQRTARAISQALVDSLQYKGFGVNVSMTLKDKL